MSGASSILLSPSRQPVASPGSTIKQISANAPVFDGAESLELPEVRRIPNIILGPLP